jgi:hypothetical protein
MEIQIDLFVIFIFSTKQKLLSCYINFYHLLELWTLWKLIIIKFIKKMFGCGVWFN